MPRVKQIASISLKNLCLYNILANIDRLNWKFTFYLSVDQGLVPPLPAEIPWYRPFYLCSRTF